MQYYLSNRVGPWESNPAIEGKMCDNTSQNRNWLSTKKINLLKLNQRYVKYLCCNYTPMSKIREISHTKGWTQSIINRNPNSGSSLLFHSGYQSTFHIYDDYFSTAGMFTQENEHK